MSFLRGIDLGKYPDPRKIIRTAALIAQQIASLEPTNAWILTILDRGEIIEGIDGWPKSIAKRLMQDSYLESAKAQGIRRTAIAMLVSKRLKEVFGNEIKTHQPAGQGRRWILPRLERARELFSEAMHTEYEWDDLENGEDERKKATIFD